MAEETHQSTQPRMTGQLANLASRVDHECLELVWESGQVLRRGLPERTQKSPSCNGDETFTTKRARFGSLNSGLGDYPFPSHTKLANHDKGDSYPKYTHTNSLQDKDHPALLPELYSSNFDVFLEHNRSNNNDKHLTDSQIVPVDEHATLKLGYASKFVEEVPQLTTTRKSSLQQCQASVPFMRSRGISSQTPVSMDRLPNSKLPEQNSGPDKKRETVNFSLFRPTAFVKASIEKSGATWPLFSRAEELKSKYKRYAPGSSNPVESMLVEPANGSKGVTGLHNQPNPMETKVELVPLIAKPPDEALPDEHSETIGHNDAFTNMRVPDHVHVQTSSLEANSAKGKPETGKSIEPPYASYSVCSRGASNDPTYTLKSRCEDTEGSASAYPSDDDEEEQQVPARGRTGAKRYRTSEVHNLSERKRRDKINKKMRALQELIPNCNKVDKASMLDEAIEYLKSLQFQVQMMSMGTGLCMPPMMLPPMVLPTRMQQIHALQEAHFSPMGVGMGMRMHLGVGCNPAQSLPLPISGAAAVPGITESRLQMLGFLSQALPMPLLRAPFIPLHGWPSIQPVLVPGVSGASAPVESLGSVPLSSSKNSIQKINSKQ